MRAYLVDLITFVAGDIIEVVSYLNPVLIISPVFLLICLLMAGRRRDRAGTYMQLIAKLLLGLGYCLVLFMITLLSRESGSRTGVDLLPFATMGHGAQADAYVVENILLFIPLGILIACIFPGTKSSRNVVCAGFTMSLLIEVTQYLTGCGYAQTDDLITNTIGTWIGFWGFVKLRQMLSDERQER